MSTTSVWKANAKEAVFPTLTNDISVDVAVIGGGITGITAAYHLSRAGKKVAVLEARNVGDGDTGSSTGNLYCTIGDPGMKKIISNFNEKKLKEVVESRAFAVNFIRERIEEFQIDCDFRIAPWCLFTEDDANRPYIEKQIEAAEKVGLILSKEIPIPLKITYGFQVPGQAQFNPFQYVNSFAKKIVSPNCSIYENTRVTKIEEGKVCRLETTSGVVTAENVVMATHTPLGIYMVQTSLQAYREYAIAVKLNGEYPPAGIFWDLQEKEHYSMRTYNTEKGQVLMVLGEAQMVGKKENNEECFSRLEKFLRERFFVQSVEYRWSAQQFKSADGLPYIGLSSGNEKIYIATGFSADGLTYGTLAGKIISDQITGIENKWSETYDASRMTPVASAKRFLKENLHVAGELIKDYIFKAEEKDFADVTPGGGKIVEIKDQKCAVSRDENGALNVVSAVCTHLGCIVHWNEVEKTWDCPCHGSRFTRSGEVIEGPAIAPLKRVDVS